MAPFPVYVSGSSLARQSPGTTGLKAVSELADIVERAIHYTDELLHIRPSYRASAVAGLRRLRVKWANERPDDPAIARLDAYLETLNANPQL